MNINDQLKEVIKKEVLKKKSQDSAEEFHNRRIPITRRSIELIHEEKRLMGLFELECDYE